MYYVCDSEMMRDFEGLCDLDRREWNSVLEKNAREKYLFGRIMGVDGGRRIGIDYVGEGT
jgi:hypothetical protein